MPLHDWTSQPGWDGVHHLWIAELLRWVKPLLPAGFRAEHLVELRLLLLGHRPVAVGVAEQA